MQAPSAAPALQAAALPLLGDDRETIQPGDPLLLIVENDLAFAKLLLEAARDKGFKGLVTSLGARRTRLPGGIGARRSEQANWQHGTRPDQTVDALGAEQPVPSEEPLLSPARRRFLPPISPA